MRSVMILKEDIERLLMGLFCCLVNLSTVYYVISSFSQRFQDWVVTETILWLDFNDGLGQAREHVISTSKGIICIQFPNWKSIHHFGSV